MRPAYKEGDDRRSYHPLLDFFGCQIGLLGVEDRLRILRVVVGLRVERQTVVALVRLAVIDAALDDGVRDAFGEGFAGKNVRVSVEARASHADRGDDTRHVCSLLLLA